MSATYFASDHLNFSTLRLFKSDTPAKVKVAWDGRANEDAKKGYFMVGSMTHAALFERDLLPQFARTGGIRRDDRTKEFQKLKADNPQVKYWLTDGKFDSVNGMYASAMRHPFMQDILAASPILETPVYGFIDSVPCKVKPDCYVKDWETVVDPKTTTDASYRGFVKAADEYDFGARAAFTFELMPSLKEYVYLLIENVEPYLVGTPQAIVHGSKEHHAGAAQCSEWLGKWKACQQSGVWPGYDSEPVPAEFPEWLINKMYGWK